MKLLKKILAGTLLTFGFLCLMIAAVEILDPQVDEDKTSTIAGGLALGVPPTVFGGWLIWGLVQQHQREQRERLQTAFFRLLRSDQGRINLLNFVMATNSETEVARQFLDAKAREFNATFDISEDGGVLYHFHFNPELAAESSDAESLRAVLPEPMDSPTNRALESVDPANATTVMVILENLPRNQVIGVIKVIRGATGLGLKEAKQITDAVPSIIMTAAPPAIAHQLKRDLEQLGATVRIK